jgi:hypothetical protein
VTRPDQAEAVARLRSAPLPGWPTPESARYRDPQGLLEAALRQWFEVHVRQGPRRWPLGLPSQAVRGIWTGTAADAGYAAFCERLFGRPLPVADDATAMPRTWEGACRSERLDPHRPAHLPVLFLVDQTLHVPGGARYTSQCTGRVCRVFPPEVCVRHAFAPTRRFTTWASDSGQTRPY